MMIQKAIDKKIKSLTIFLAVALIAAALVWLILEIAVSKPVKKAPPKPAVSKNLAGQKVPAVEKVPLISENFETYRFRDPFEPLPLSQAPEENRPLSAGTGSSSGSASNTAPLILDKPQVLDISIAGGKEAASVKINGKTGVYAEGQTVAGYYKIVDISSTTETVEFLRGDQKFIVSITKKK